MDLVASEDGINQRSVVFSLVIKVYKPLLYTMSLKHKFILWVFSMKTWSVESTHQYIVLLAFFFQDSVFLNMSKSVIKYVHV